jgi:aminoglycoside phosphotransferase (APT) family kinase protein
VRFIDTEVVANQLRAWLRAKLDMRVHITDINIPKQGYSNVTWFVEAVDEQTGGAVPLVVRAQPEVSRLFPTTDVLHQWRVMKALEPLGVPLPPLLAAEEDSAVIGAPFFVMGHVIGRIPPDLPPYNVGGWLLEAEPAQRTAVWENGVRALAELHSVDWKALHFLDVPEDGGVGLEQYVRWVERWYSWASKGRDLPLLDQAMTYLIEHRPRDAAIGVAWGDARPGNMIFNADNQVIAILDWEMAALGPAELDVAWWLFADRFYSDGFGVSPLPGLPSRERIISVYESVAERPLPALKYYEILAAFRMAIVFIRSTTDHLASGLLSPDTTMDAANPATQIVAELMGLPIPELSPEVAKVIASRTRS